TLINDPLRTLKFDANGKAGPTGTLHVSGTWQRNSQALAVAVDAPAVPVGPALADWLATLCPETAQHLRHLHGYAKLSGEIEYQPGLAGPKGESPSTLHYDWRCELKDGKLEHPQIPLPLDHVEASVRCVDGRIDLKRFAACSGVTRMALNAT